MSLAVLDASALLAYLRDEPGAEAVAEAISAAAVISTVNFAEVLSRLCDQGGDPRKISEGLTRRGLIDGAVAVEPFTTADAVEAARLRRLTRHLGLSLGDRACLALGTRFDGPVLTADSSWSQIELDLDLRQIR